MPITAITNISSAAGIPTASSVVLRKQALDVIEQDLYHMEAAMEDRMEQQNGRVVKFYRPDNFAAASLATDTEGAEKSALTYSEREVAFALGKYSDWTAVSGFIQDTAPTPVLNNAAERLSYRGKLRFDNLMKAIYDAEAPGMTMTALATNLVVNDLRNARTQMRQQSVKPQRKFGNRFLVHAAPVVLFDLVRDPAAGGYLDIIKRNGMSENSRLFDYNLDNNFADIAGCHIRECTNVTVNTSVTPNLYRVYIHGEGGFVSSTLRGRNTQTPETARFTCHVEKTGIDGWNPTGEMGGFASYQAYWTGGNIAGNATIGDVYRDRIFDIASSVA